MAEQLCPVCSFTKSLMKHMRRDGRCTAVSSAIASQGQCECGCCTIVEEPER